MHILPHNLFKFPNFKYECFSTIYQTLLSFFMRFQLSARLSTEHMAHFIACMKDTTTKTFL